jgi:hypothetical protein
MVVNATYNNIPRMGQIKDHKVGIGYFFAKHAALNSENKYWLSRNKDEEVESEGTWRKPSTCKIN